TVEATLTTNLASEVSRATTAEASKEALANKSTSVSTDGTSDTKYPSVKSVKDYVDASATSGSTALATEISRATTAEATLTANLASEVSRATTAEATLTATIATETTRAITAEASKEALANKSTSVSTDGTSDTKYPSVKSVKDYVDNSVNDVTDELYSNLLQSTFVMSKTPSVKSKVKMFINGLRVRNSAYSVSGNTVTLDTLILGFTLLLNDRIQFDYFY
ncbi:hypothetical protein, partial [Flavobacterium yafengii]|uniref:hypothetical protein n=1 Tax=Flavobacterium yafengii TaxID=3041253 RepID=UPI0024A9C1D4